MYQSETIDKGPEALLSAFAANIRTLVANLNMAHAEGYVVMFVGDNQLGRNEAANVGMIAGGNIQSLRRIKEEVDRMVANAEAEARQILAEEEAAKMQHQRFDDYLRKVEFDDEDSESGGVVPNPGSYWDRETKAQDPDEVFMPRGLMTEELIEVLKARGLARELSPLEALAKRFGLRVVSDPSDGGPVVRCAEYPNCACGQ